MSFSASDATAQAAAKAASRAHAQAGRSQTNNGASSGSFDDLLNSIPDAPPEPRAQARPDAPVERPQAPDRAASRSDRPERTERQDRKAKAPSENKTPTAAEDAAPQDATTAQTDKAVTETKPASDETNAKSEAKAETATDKPAETAATDTPAAAQAVAEALVPQAVVIDPAAIAVTAEPVAEGDKALKSVTDQAVTAPAAPAAQSASEQQAAAALADQKTGLTPDDAEALSALAAKAQLGLKDAQTDKAAKKATSDKPTEAAKLTGAAVATDANAQAQPASGETDKTSAKPVQSDLMKVAAEHQRSDADAKPAAENAALNANASGVAAKAADTLPTQTFAATLHQTHAATAAAASGPAQALNDDKAVPVGNVAVEVTAKIASGKNQFDIRLDPEELGRIHVKVNVDRDGNISTHMMADRPETLDLLRREVQGLERALQDAGLKTSDNGLQFSLRDQSANQQQDRQNSQPHRIATEDDQSITTPVTILARDYGRYSLRPSGVDIRV